MLLFNAPQNVPDTLHRYHRRLFLAGGISEAPDWQSDIIKRLASTDLLILNPRRANYPKNNPAAEREQVGWEHVHLRRAGAVSFWFPSETLCPITLFELGTCIARGQTIFVGIHPKYARKTNVLAQLELARPEVEAVFSLEKLAEQVKAWANQPNLGAR